MFYSQTVSKYEETWDAPFEMYECNDILQWWMDRRYHTVPLVAVYNKWVESGSTRTECYDDNGNLKLSVATWHDICHMLFQNKDYKAFIGYGGKSTDRGCNQM